MATLKIEKWERWFLYASVVILVGFLVAILASIGEAGIHLPTDEGSLDPNKVAETPPFDNPGLRQTGDGAYEAVMVARTWQFTTGETDADGIPTITVPAGSEVTFIVTSGDVIHGLYIPQTDVNAMIIPGRVTKISQKFETPGEYTFLCHEFCGLANEQIGHHSMYGKVVVQP